MYFYDILLGLLASMAVFGKLQFYIIKHHEGNKNTRICVEMYEETCTFSAIGQHVTCLEFPIAFLTAIYRYRHQQHLFSLRFVLNLNKQEV